MAAVVMRAQFSALLFWMSLNSRGLYMRLYSNNRVPAETDTIALYTECTFGGYVARSLNAWSIPALNPSNRGQIQHPVVTWTATGGSPQSVYGYYITDKDQNWIYWADRVPGMPIVMADSAEILRVITRLPLRNDPSP